MRRRALEVDAVISELGRRLAANLEPAARERLGDVEARPARSRTDARAFEPGGGSPERAFEHEDPDADFALSLSSASLRLAEDRAATEALAPRVAAEAVRSSDPGREPEPDFSSPAPAAGRSDSGRPGPASRAIDAYREIARAPVGERIRIVV